MYRILASLLLLALTFTAGAAEIETGDPALDAAFAQLLERDFDIKAQGVQALADSGHPRSQALLQGLLEGELRYLKRQQRLVWMRDRMCSGMFSFGSASPPR